jgi:hypothetical protein
MSANETYELAVQLRGEGIEETNSQLEGTEEQFNETSDTVDEQGQNMEGFASRWQGAMSAIMTGLAVAAGGLLAQVPVIGELMSGLVAVIEAVAFQMDQVLRPVLQPATDLFFGLADAIFGLNGPLGTLIGIMGTVAAAFGLIIGASAAVATATGGAITTFGPLIAILKAIAAAVVAVIGGLTALTAGIIIAAAAIVAILIIFTDIEDLFIEFISKAKQWGIDLMKMFAAGIMTAITAPINAAQEALSGVVGAIGFDIRANDRMAQRWGRDVVTEFSAGMETASRTELPPNVMGDVATGGGGGGQRPVRNEPVINLDGRDVTKETRRQRGKERTSRGRHS